MSIPIANPTKYLVGNFLFTEFPTATIPEMMEYLHQQDEVGLDIETSRKFKRNRYNEKVYRPGLDPYMTKICMLQIGTLDRVFIIDMRQFSQQALSPLINYLHKNKKVTFVMQNGKFEGKHLLHNFGIELVKVWDIMLVEMILTNGKNLGYSLADIAGRYLNTVKLEKLNLFSSSMKYNSHIDEEFNDFAFRQEEAYIIDKSTRLGFINIGDKPFTTKQLLYAADDITMPLQIKAEQLKNPYQPTTCFKLENAFSQCIAKIELKGLGIDAAKWLDLYNTNWPVYVKATQKLNDYVVDNYPAFTGTGDMFSNGRGTCTIKWSSSKQVIALFRHIGKCPKEMSKQTGKEEYTVGADALQQLLDKEHNKAYFKMKDLPIVGFQTLIVAYLQLKKREQACTTFGKKWLKYIHPITGRVHTGYRQLMATGRISSSNPKKLGVCTVMYIMNRVNSGNPFTTMGNPEPTMTAMLYRCRD